MTSTSSPTTTAPFWPAATYSNRFAEDAPGLKETIQLLNEQFTDELMSELTYRVDVAGEEVETVAHDFLVQSGLLDA